MKPFDLCSPTKHPAQSPSSIRLEEEKVIAEFRQQLIKVAFEKALTGIKSRMSPSLHRKYIDAKIALMSSRL